MATGEAELVANTYYRCSLTAAQLQELVREDQKAKPKARAIYRVWPDFPVSPLIDRSVATVKADAARRSYEASGADMTWAVIDSGIDAKHPHFKAYKTLGGDVASCTVTSPRPGRGRSAAR